MITHRTSIVNGWIPLILILFVTTLAYLPIFRNNFVIDDHVFVGNYHPTVVEAFRGVVPLGHEGVYRPLRGIIYTVYYNLFGTNPFFYHLHSLLVHLMATVLVFLIIREIYQRNPKSEIRSTKQYQNSNDQNSKQFRIWNFFRFKFVSNFDIRASNLPFMAALLFGLHPAHTESITYIAASMEMTGVVFFFAAFLAYLKEKRVASVMLAILAFFTYEMTVTLPLLLLLYEWTLGKKDWRKTLPYWAGAGVYLFVRFVIMGIDGRSTYPGGSMWYMLLTLPKVLIHYLWVTLWPVGLMNNHIISPGIEAFVYRGYRTAAILGQSILDPEILASITVITIIIFITIIKRKKQPLVSFGIGWFFVSLLPVMGFVPGGSMFNEKMLYIPSFGFVMVLSSAFYNFYNRYKRYNRYIWAGIILVFLLYGARTSTRNADWHDDVTLWQKDVAAAPAQNAYAYYALGNAYYNRKELDRAAAAYEQSVAINPGFAVGYASLSRTYRDMGNTELSNVYYQKAGEVEPGFWGRP